MKAGGRIAVASVPGLNAYLLLLLPGTKTSNRMKRNGKKTIRLDPAPSKMTGNSSVLDQWLVFLNDGNGNKSSAPQGLTVPS